MRMISMEFHDFSVTFRALIKELHGILSDGGSWLIGLECIFWFCNLLFGLLGMAGVSLKEE